VNKLVLLTLKPTRYILKTTGQYLADYLKKYNELASKNELWRLRVTEQEFVTEIEKIRAWGAEARKANYLNEYAITRGENGQVAVLLMNKLTPEEAREQIKRNAEAAALQFAEEAPQIQEQLKKIQTPLRFKDVTNLYSWLCRKQITMAMMPKEVLEAFSKTRQYQTLLKRSGGV
jgi:rubrerythrin